MTRAMAPVAAEIIAGRPPRNEMETAIVKDAKRPRRGSTPAMIEKEMASGISARATTSPASTSVRSILGVRNALRSPKMLRTEVLAGLVVALALIPEAISFSIIAGVDPRLGLFASFTMAVSISFLGGRPAMISAATGAIALVIAPVAREYGLDYFIATVILAGIFQVTLGALGVAKLMRFIPRSVICL